VCISMRKTYVLLAILSSAGCSAGNGSELPDLHEPKGHGGAESGGATNGRGGTSSGGQTASLGGSTASGSGGSLPGNGGISGKGGQGAGGTLTGSGGSASGGRQNSGGVGAGGKSGSGGETVFGAGGKAVGSGGSPGSGGKSPGAGGASGGAGSGGRASGGTTATGSGGTTAPPTNCSEANRTLSNNGTGKHCNYTYEYWKDSGNGSLTLTPNGFNVDWSNINNLLGRKGIRPGSGNLVVNYEANYQPNGNSYLCIYGWTRNPLVEYYIVDSWGTWRPPGGQGHVGTLTSDGGTYDIYKVGRTGPSIDGNTSFTQYFSVRTAKKTSGVITIANHFNAWKNAGMPMGSFYEVSMTVEGYQSSGKAEVKFSMQ